MKFSFKRRRRSRLTALAGVLVLGLTFLAACSAQSSTSPAQCAFVVGDGTYDRAIHQITLPNTKLDLSNTNKVAQYVPCGPRNFIINNGTVTNPANHSQVGDRYTVSTAYTEPADTGTAGLQMNIWSSAYFTLNEGDAAMRVFYPLCYKYNCYTEDADKAADANFSTPGWNGLLAENFGPNVDAAIRQVLSSKYKPDIWQHPELWNQVASDVSTEFMSQIRSVTGSTQDIFCGSGDTSGFLDRSQPKKFTCGNVRFKINLIDPSDPDVKTSLQAAAQAEVQSVANAKQFAANEKLYGKNTASVLGQLAEIKQCQAKPGCIVNLGGLPASASVPATGR